MTVCNRGDVVLVPFPFSNQTTVKKRPSVIVSSDVYNNTSSDIVIMAITGKTGNLTIGDCLIEDWKIAGLLKPSSVKPAISTIEQSLVLRKLGKLSPKDLILMENALKEFLDLK